MGNIKRSRLRLAFISALLLSASYLLGFLLWKGRSPASFHEMSLRSVQKTVQTMSAIPEFLRTTSTAIQLSQSTAKAATDQEKFYVTARTAGRLGNHIFQYASLLGLAEVNNRSSTAFYPLNSLVAKAFHLTRVSNMSQEGFKELLETGSARYDPKFEILPPENVIVGDYLQSWKYFRHIEKLIRQEFTFRDLIRSASQKLLTQLTKGRQNITTVGVHVRRGDYVGPKTVGQFQLPPPSYYQNAANYFRRKYNSVVFIVVTVDHEWSQTNLNMTDFIIADDADPPVHLSLLTLCDHVIMSIGTFGWWGGFLGEGEVVYYKNPVYPNITARKIFVATDHFLPEWVGIGD